MNRLKRILWTLLALAFLATSWFWDWIARPIRWLVAHIPLERLKCQPAATRCVECQATWNRMNGRTA